MSAVFILVYKKRFLTMFGMTAVPVILKKRKRLKNLFSFVIGGERQGKESLFFVIGVILNSFFILFGMTISIVINEGKSDKKSFYILREIPNFVRNDNRSCYSEEALATEESFFAIGVILNRFLISFGMTILLHLEGKR